MNAPWGAESRHHIRLFMVILVLGTLVRGAWLIKEAKGQPDAPLLAFPDEIQYWDMGRSLREGGGLRDELGFRATRMPLYPGLLALAPPAPLGITSVKLMQCCVGGLGAAFVGWLAARMFGRPTGWLAGLAAAVDPFAVFFSSLLLTETLFLLALVALWAAAWDVLRPSSQVRPGTWSYVGVGVLAVIGVYVRESTLGLVFALCVLMAVFLPPGRMRWLGPSIVLGVVGLSLVPWAVRNQAVIGEPCLTTTRFGISLYDGVRPGAKGDSDLGEVKAAREVAGLSEAEWNRWFVEHSWQAIRDEPGRVIRLGGVKLARMWNPFPNVESHQSASVRTISLLWTLPTFVFAGVGAILWPMRWGREGVLKVLFLLLPALCLSALHSLFVGSVRYRLGAMPMLEVLAAAGLVAFVARLRNRGPCEAERPT